MARAGGALQAAEPPANDNFTNATVLVGSYFSLTAYMADSTVEPGEPPPAYGSVWWTWTAPESGVVTFSSREQTPKAEPKATTWLQAWPDPTYDDTNGWPTNMVIPVRNGASSQWGGSAHGGTDINIDILNFNYSPVSVYQGVSVSNLTLVTNFWPFPSYYEGVFNAFHALKGQIYKLRVDRGPLSSTSSFTMLLTTAPANDDFTNRMVLSGVGVFAQGHTVSATREPNEPVAGGPAVAGHTVWWTWTPQVAGNVTFRGSENFHASIFRGNTLESLQLLGRSDAGVVRLPAIPGQPMQIAVDTGSSPAEDDNYSLSLHLEPLPPIIRPHSGRILSDGSFEFRADQLRGRKITIFVSTNLVNWESVGTGVVNGEGATFRDFAATNSPTLFYSIRLAP
jgi:hypothetical protein